MALLGAFFWSCLATLLFAYIFNIHGKKLLIAALFGGVGWTLYVGLEPLAAGEIPRYVLGTMAVTALSEAGARRFHTPVTVFLVPGLIPLVPGGGVYRTMEYCLAQETALFLETGLHTFAIAGSMALGVMAVSSAVRLGTALCRRIGG